MIKVEEWGEVKALHQGKNFCKVIPPLKTVRCYMVDGLLIDSGLHCFSKQVGQWARQMQVHSSVITHHHEDHSGNAQLLQSQGIKVYSSSKARLIMAQGFKRSFYQRVVWDHAPSVQLSVAPACIETNRFQFEIIPAPGHCDDQVVLYEPQQGWLFSGDAFLSSKVKYFRGDEDFYQTIQTIKRICQLSFEQIFCAHYPVFSQGKRHFEDKLNYLLSLEEEVKLLRSRGLTLKEITRRMLGRENYFLYALSWGDFCKRNLVRSILQGPKIRRDIKKIQDLNLGQD